MCTTVLIVIPVTQGVRLIKKNNTDDTEYTQLSKFIAQETNR